MKSSRGKVHRVCKGIQTLKNMGDWETSTGFCRECEGLGVQDEAEWRTEDSPGRAFLAIL